MTAVNNSDTEKLTMLHSMLFIYVFIFAQNKRTVNFSAMTMGIDAKDIPTINEARALITQ